MNDYVFCPANKKDFELDIIMATYNHEKYISQAIESILMQRTNYSYRIIIGEDCSTDGTRSIVSSYYEKYPDKISLILWKKNVGARRNSREMYRQCRAKYIATLEGDDYWTDPLKLAKQLSFLEEHQDFITTYHNVRCVDRDGKLLHKDFEFYPISDEYYVKKSESIKYRLFGQTSSMVSRNFFLNMDEKTFENYFNCPANGDMKFAILVGLQGSIYYFNDIMSDHRRVFEGDSWTARTTHKNLLYFHYKSKIEIKKLLLSLGYKTENFDVSTKEYIALSYGKFIKSLKFEDLKIYLLFILESIKGR